MSSLNTVGYLLKIKKKMENLDFLQKLIEEQTETQNSLLAEIEALLHENSIKGKTARIDEIFQRDKEEFDEFNQQQMDLLRHYAHIAYQQSIASEIGGQKFFLDENDLGMFQSAPKQPQEELGLKELQELIDKFGVFNSD